MRHRVRHSLLAVRYLGVKEQARIDPPEAMVFAGDGQGMSKWGRLLEKAAVPSPMIVGVHRLTDESLRLHEYSRRFEPERFAKHEKFFVEGVR